MADKTGLFIRIAMKPSETRTNVQLIRPFNGPGNPRNAIDFCNYVEYALSPAHLIIRPA